MHKSHFGDFKRPAKITAFTEVKKHRLDGSYVHKFFFWYIMKSIFAKRMIVVPLEVLKNKFSLELSSNVLEIHDESYTYTTLRQYHACVCPVYV